MTTPQSSSQADGYADGDDLVRAKVIAEIAAACGVSHSEVVPHARLWEDFRAQLSDLLELKLGLEVTFLFGHIPSLMVDRWKTVGDVFTYVEGRLGQTA